MDYKTETQQLLRETARKIKIEDIKAGLLLMAWNLDNLEDLNKTEFKEPKQAIGKPESHEKEPSRAIISPEIEIPKEVFKLFFRFPYEIIVWKKLKEGLEISHYEEKETKYFWDKTEKEPSKEVLKCA